MYYKKNCNYFNEIQQISQNITAKQKMLAYALIIENLKKRTFKLILVIKSTNQLGFNDDY